MLVTTLCYLERDGCWLMLHRTAKEQDVNKGKCSNWSLSNLALPRMVDMSWSEAGVPNLQDLMSDDLRWS